MPARHNPSHNRSHAGWCGLLGPATHATAVPKGLANDHVCPAACLAAHGGPTGAGPWRGFAQGLSAARTPWPAGEPVPQQRDRASESAKTGQAGPRCLMMVVVRTRRAADLSRCSRCHKLTWRDMRALSEAVGTGGQEVAASMSSWGWKEPEGLD